MFRRFLLPFFLFLAFLSESIFVELFPSAAFAGDRMLVPRFVLMMIMLIALFYQRNMAVLYGIIFGLLFDIVYTDIIGIYMFSFAIIAYVVSYSMKVLQRNIFVVLFISLLGLSCFEGLVYGIYLLIDVAHLEGTVFLYNRLLPTLVLNGVFLIVIYSPMRKFLIGLEKLASKESTKLLQ